MTATTDGSVATKSTRPTAGTWRARLRSARIGPLVAIVGSVALLVAGLLPVWGTRLVAPQYPKGLSLWFYGDRVEGPVREVNGLNHYIGMQAIDLARVPEMALWPLAVVGSALLLVVAVLWRGWLSRLALIGLWLVPLVVLLDIQRWLIIFGTDLDPRAALRLEGLVPLVVGPSQVWNFSVLTYPGPALLVILGVALVATLARRAEQPEPRVRTASAAIALAIAIVGTVLLVPIGPAEAAFARADRVQPEAPGHGDQDTPSVGDARHVHVGDARHVHVGGTDASGASGLDLQALVDAAPEGSTLRVPAGDYRVHLVIDRPLTLEADGHVRLGGSGLGSIVTITADRVTLRGFHLSGTGGQVEAAAAVKVLEARDVTIEDNRMDDFFHGIAILGASDVLIAGNTLTGSGLQGDGAGHLGDGAGHLGDGAGQAVTPGADPRSIAPDAAGAGPQGQGDGIYLWHSRAATIRDNTIRDVRDGIYLSYVEDALVDDNRVESSRYAVHTMFGGPVTVFGNSAQGNLAGFVFMYGDDVLAGRNVIRDQRSAGTGVGIAVKDVKGLRIVENVIARNRIGLRAEGTRRLADAEAVVLRNRFGSNDMAISLFPSADLGFAANTFEGNLTDVHADDRGVGRQNDWTFQGTGNRWADYAGYDLDGDAVGDVPHLASGGLDVLLAQAPVLQLYRGSPAMGALGSAQELWEWDRAVVVEDLAPRLDDHAPTVADLASDLPDAAGVGSDALPWQVAGASLVLLAVLGVALTRSRQRAGAA